MNRRKRKPVSKFPILNRIIGYSLVLLLMMGAFGLGTVYLRHQTHQTANKIKVVERKIALEKRRFAELGDALTRRTTRSSLQALIAKRALDLRAPNRSQIVRVTVDVESRLYAKSTERYLTAANF